MEAQRFSLDFDVFRGEVHFHDAGGLRRPPRKCRGRLQFPEPTVDVDTVRGSLNPQGPRWFPYWLPWLNFHH